MVIYKEDELIKRYVRAGLTQKDAVKACDIERKYLKDLNLIEE